MGDYCEPDKRNNTKCTHITHITHMYKVSTEQSRINTTQTADDCREIQYEAGCLVKRLDKIKVY